MRRTRRCLRPAPPPLAVRCPGCSHPALPQAECTAGGGGGKGTSGPGAGSCCQSELRGLTCKKKARVA